MTATPSIDLPAWMAEQLYQASPDLTTRNLKRSLRNAAAGARLIQVDGLDKNLAAEVATSLAAPLKSFTGSSAASIDAYDAIRYWVKDPPVSCRPDRVRPTRAPCIRTSCSAASIPAPTATAVISGEAQVRLHGGSL
jgi:hypothetical protein